MKTLGMFHQANGRHGHGGPLETSARAAFRLDLVHLDQARDIPEPPDRSGGPPCFLQKYSATDWPGVFWSRKRSIRGKGKKIDPDQRRGNREAHREPVKTRRRAGELVGGREFIAGCFVQSFVHSQELQRKVMKAKEAAAVTKCRILRRFAPGAGALLLFGFTLTAGAQQNRSAAQAHPPQVSETLAEAQSSLEHGNAEEAIRILSGYLQTRPKDSAGRTLLAQAYASIGQKERAEEELQGVLQIAPNDSIALAALGEIYEREGQPEKAEPLLANAAKINHSDPRIQMEWAVALVHLHKYPEAQSALAGLSPPTGREERVGFHRLKASVALGLGNAPTAASEMEKALALEPADPGLAMATATAELQAKNWQRAASLTEPLFSETHNPQAGLVRLEAELDMHSDFQQTLELLRAIELPISKELELHQRVAELLISHEKYSESIAELKRAAELDPERADLEFDLALAQFRAGRLDDAVASAEKCKELGDNAELEDLIGDIQEARGDSLAAVKSYQAAVELAPNEEKYRLSLAVELIRHSSFEPARVVLKQGEELQPESWRIQLALGMVEHFGGTDEDATKYLLRAAELAPEPQAALQYLGDIQMDRASAPDPGAVARLCEYSDGQPKDGHMQYYCGAVLFRRDYVTGDKTHAAEILRRLHASLALLPQDDAAPHCQLGKAYRWLGRWPEALRESEICARMDPGSADAHYRLAQIYEHMEQPEKQRKEIKLYEAASTRVADENARREATMKTFLYTMQKEAQSQKDPPDQR
jgi:Flp pilus assembly protein TadD